MNAPKFEIPAEVRNMVEKTIEQAEKAFDMFFKAANSSMAPFAHRERRYQRRHYPSLSKT